MKTARQALNSGVATLGHGMTASGPGVCPECGKEITLSYSVDSALEFPALEQWSKIVICDPCADFRRAVRDRSERLIRMVWRYRSTCLKICQKDLGHEEEERKLAEVKREAEARILPAIKSLNAALAFRARRPASMSETWLPRVMNIWSTRESYGETDYRWVSTQDHTHEIVQEMIAYYGITIRNHWNDLQQIDHFAHVPD